MTTGSAGILVMGTSEIEALLNLDQCIEAVEEAFKAHAQGKTLTPGLLHTDAPQGDFHVKTGGLDLGKLYFGLKANGRYPENQQRFGLPNVSGIIYLADGDDGTPVAVMDSALITLNRTGAAAAVAAKFLARPGPTVATICGCGKQGRIQLAAIARVRPLERAFAYGRNPERVRVFAEEMSRRLAIPVIPALNLNEATTQSSVVVTCTSAREFFLRPADISPGTFIAAMGADSSYKQELDPRLMVGNKLVVDIAVQAAHVGELHHAIDQGLMTIEDVHAELGEIVSGLKSSRTSPEEIILFDSTGTALQDIAVASMVYQRAVQAGKGTRVSLRD
jgi:ornithine cyclodeaminase/alanine dehydrogenase